MRVTFLILILFRFVIVFSQLETDSVLFLNGKVIHGEIIGFEEVDGDSIVKVETTSKTGKKRIEPISTYRVFSYTKDGNSKVLYREDEFSGNFLTVKEAHDVTIGSYDARKTFKPHFAFWSGFGLGFGASIWDTYLTKKAATDSSLIAPKEPGFFRSNPSVFPFFVPVVVSVSWSFPTFRVKEKNMIHKNYLNNENYYRGYHRIAKQKRMLGGLFGSIAGIATGLIIHYSVQ